MGTVRGSQGYEDVESEIRRQIPRTCRQVVLD